MYQYLQQLHSVIMNQEKKIQQLIHQITQLSKEIEEIKRKPTIHVDKMEYKFDQLKVETLEGTLNIGLNPSDAEAIEDFAVQNGTPNNTQDPKQMFQHVMEIEEELYRYLDSDLMRLVNIVAERMNRGVDERYLEFVKEDIKRQVPARVQYYLQQYPPPQSIEKMVQWKQNILQVFSKEMENGIQTFFTNIPNNLRG